MSRPLKYSTQPNEGVYGHEKKESFPDGARSPQRLLHQLPSPDTMGERREVEEYGKERHGNEPSTKGNKLMSIYLSLSGMLGFKEKFSLILMFIFGGALLGFCLARTTFMDGKLRPKIAFPGDYFWFNQAPYKGAFIAHIFFSIFAGIFIGAQFVPAIRRQFILLHRVNGYICIITVGIANIAGAVVARRSLGGELNVQSAYWTLALMSTFSLALGWWNARKDTRAHRKWMLRSVVFFSVVITGKLTTLAANAIVTFSGEYYAPWRCDEILSVLNDKQQLSRLFPQCEVMNNMLINPTTSVTVRCSVNGGPLQSSSCERVTHGMALWIALVIHILGVEIYLRSTERANDEKNGNVLQPRDPASYGSSHF